MKFSASNLTDTNYIKSISIVLVTIVYFYPFIYFNNICEFFISLIYLLGCLICINIIYYQFGYETLFTKYFYSGNKNAQNCENILNFSVSKFIPNLNIVDFIFLGFIVLFLFFEFSFISNLLQQTKFLFVILNSIFFILITLIFWHIYKTIKSFCRIFVFLISIIGLQEFLLIYFFLKGKEINLFQNKLYFSFEMSLFFEFSILSASVWLFIKPNMVKKNQINNYQKIINEIKTNTNLFLLFLKEQRSVDTTIWSNDILFGNKEAKVIVLVTLNPYSRICAARYHELNSLLQFYPKEVLIILRFRVNFSKKYRMQTIVTKYIFNIYFFIENYNSKKEIIDSWFKLMKLNEWKAKWNIAQIESDYKELLLKHKLWFEENKILNDPTVFINGFELPSPYDIKDLAMKLSEIRDSFTI